MVGSIYAQCHFLPLPVPKDYRSALTASCSDLVEAVLALHSNTDSAQDTLSFREAAEKRAQFSRMPMRSVSAPPRKRWFRKERGDPDDRKDSSQGGVVCDEFTRKLVAAITTWHDIHSSVIRLSIDQSSSAETVSTRSDYSSDYSDDEDDPANPSSSTKLSISNPELTNNKIAEMFPDLSDHWR